MRGGRLRGRSPGRTRSRSFSRPTDAGGRRVVSEAPEVLDGVLERAERGPPLLSEEQSAARVLKHRLSPNARPRIRICPSTAPSLRSYTGINRML